MDGWNIPTQVFAGNRNEGKVHKTFILPLNICIYIILILHFISFFFRLSLKVLNGLLFFILVLRY